MGDLVKKKGKDGRFLGWYIRYVDAQGVRRQRATHHPTLAAARQMLVEVEADVARQRRSGVSSIDAPGTVAELCERYLTEFRSTKVRVDLKKYRRTAHLCLQRVLPILGARRLFELSRRDLEQARDDLSATYRANTVRATLRPLGTALGWAVRRGWLAASPMRGLDMPSAERSVEHLTQEEAVALLRAAEQTVERQQAPIRRLKARCRQVAVTLALRLGLRRGEVFGLRWADLDFHSRLATICRSFGGPTKSGKARHLPLPASLDELLRAWRAECPSTTEGLVCPVYFNRVGWKLSAAARDGGLLQMARVAGLRKFERGWHCLRHTFASAFIQNGGGLIALQRILGHADVRVTTIYAHLAPDFLAQEMERVKF